MFLHTVVWVDLCQRWKIDSGIAWMKHSLFPGLLVEACSVFWISDRATTTENGLLSRTMDILVIFAREFWNSGDSHTSYFIKKLTLNLKTKVESIDRLALFLGGRVAKGAKRGITRSPLAPGITWYFSSWSPLVSDTTEIFTTSNFIGPWYHTALLFSDYFFIPLQIVVAQPLTWVAVFVLHFPRKSFT